MTDSSGLEQRIGGKGAKLARMQALGLDVPEWFSVEAADFTAAMQHDDVRRAIERAEPLVDAGSFEQAAAEVRTAVLSLPLPDHVARRVSASWHDLVDGAAREGTMVAVRSSAIGEDGTDHSFAGQFESVLGVRTEQQLLDAVRSCWASAWTGRALAYRARHGMPALEARMGLVVQLQVDADVAGVLFTGDPISGDPHTMVASATYGLGEALVSGLANADTYRLDRRHGVIDVEIADKDLMIVPAADGLTEEAEVPPERRGARALTDAQVRELGALGERLEAAEGCAQDIEWAIAGRRLYVLQTRPVTTRLRPRGIRRTWDNSNIVESYSGVVSPLTFSFAREAYTKVYFQALKLLRLPASEMDTAQVVVRQMLGYVDGRVYYNLASWYYLLSVMPDYEKNAAAMEQMMGVRAPLDRRIAPPAGATRKVRLYAAMGWLLLTVNRRIADFRGNVQRVLRRYDLDFRSMDADELVDAYDDLRRELLSNWQTPIVGDTRVMIMFDRLRRTIARLGLDDEGTLQNDLMCGQGEVESAEPTYMLVRMAERIRASDALRAAVLDDEDEGFRARISAVDSGDARWLEEQLDVYLARFGDRCANELKLETPTLRENPAFLWSVLRNFVRQDDLTEASMLAREHAIRDAAMTLVDERFAAQGGLLKPLRRKGFEFILRQARHAVRDREAMRFDRTRVFGLARRIFTALGERLHEAGMLESPRDVILLEVEEIIGTVQGTTTITNLKGLVELRREQQGTWLASELPDRIETIGITNANPRKDAYATVDVSGDRVAGLGCCPGVVEREVRVVLSPDAGVTLGGDIMACTRTDPGWVPLFPSCGGLLVERGSLLSHSAIVAREFGIPAIVGIPGLMQWAVDGETVRMDGQSGIVERTTSPPVDASGASESEPLDQTVTTS